VDLPPASCSANQATIQWYRFQRRRHNATANSKAGSATDTEPRSARWSGRSLRIRRGQRRIGGRCIGQG